MSISGRGRCEYAQSAIAFKGVKDSVIAGPVPTPSPNRFVMRTDYIDPTTCERDSSMVNL
jgi:hypothetical protein